MHCGFVDSRLRRFPPLRSAQSCGRPVENALRFPPPAHRPAAAHKLHSAPANPYKIRDSQNHHPTTGLSLFHPGGCPDDRNHRNRDALAGILAGSDMVVLLAGLGGGTGSGVTPIMARLARAAEAVTVAAVVTPFDFEGDARNRRANAVVDRLQRDADLVMAFSNEEWINRFSGDESFLDIWDELDRHIATSLHSVVSRLFVPTSLAGSTFAPGCLSV